MKYNRIEKETFESVESNKIDNMLVDGETILWRGKPEKTAFILNSVVGMAGFAILWLLFDSFFIITMAKSGMGEEVLWFIIPFFAFHLLPVWIWISRIITSFRRWKNTDYIVTNRRILLRSGFIGIDYKNIFYKDIKNVALKVGIIDSMLGVGDIKIQCNAFDNFTRGNNNVMASAADNTIYDVKNPYEALNIIQKIILDMQTDMVYPNDLRPSENHGYKTEYKG